MDLYMILLRLIHISAGILWVGFGLFMAWIAVPAALSMRDRGTTFLHALYDKTPFLRVMPIVSLLTTVAGVLLYIRVSDNFNAAWLGSAGGIVLTIGSLAGLAAFVHGISIGQQSERQKKILDGIVSQPGGPTPEQVGALQALGESSARKSMISVVLMIVAVVGMSAARYF